MYEVATCNLNTKFGNFEFYCFNKGSHEDENILVLCNPNIKNTPYVRIQSACFTSEIFRSLDCDCHEQLEYSLRLISNEGGYLIYILIDGRGAGIFKKIQGMKITQDQNLDTAEAYKKMSLDVDPRNYAGVIDVLRSLNLTKFILLTNNPRKIQSVVDAGFNVIREAIEIKPTKHSLAYLKSKKDKLGHLFARYIK